ncbi:MAG: hypothetical protein DRI57_21845, partial [Deltaproteobacteria bacterium]
MKKFTVVFVLWFVCMAEGMAAEKTVTIVAVNWPPYSGRFLPNYGIMSELVSVAYEREDYKTEYNFMAWIRALEEVKEGKYDAVANAYYTEERAKTYLLSDAYMDCPVVFYKRKDASI